MITLSGFLPGSCDQSVDCLLTSPFLSFLFSSSLFHSTKHWYIWQVWRNCLSLSSICSTMFGTEFCYKRQTKQKNFFCFNVRSSKIGTHSNVSDPTSFFFVVLGKNKWERLNLVDTFCRLFLSTIFDDTFHRQSGTLHTSCDTMRNWICEETWKTKKK
jgi:hypothetical protein